MRDPHRFAYTEPLNAVKRTKQTIPLAVQVLHTPFEQRDDLGIRLALPSCGMRPLDGHFA
jgi:hypothetical protein